MPSLRSSQPHTRAVLAAFCVGAGASLAVLSPAVPAQEPEPQSAAIATGSGPLETTITAELLVIEGGPNDIEVRRWVPAQRLSAGDEVHYTVRVRNPGQEPVTDVVVTKRLPFGVRYQAGSATGPACDVQFSADGGNTFAAPEAPRSGSAKKVSRKAAPTPEYTHVRWVLRKPLAPGATALLRFRAVFS
ncbi:MAG TPA: hypothetical protein VFI92_10305 [Steroidobacteraceae bacterium]|nr:hypothetical protein [Steroidobacteraceae bacterium]